MSTLGLLDQSQHANWQMMQWERVGLTGILAALKPTGAIEVGVYHGGSLNLICQFATRVIAIDMDREVPGRFRHPTNAVIRIGTSQELIPQALAEFTAQDMPLNFVLVDGDHSAAGVERDLELLLEYRPREPLHILIHDSGNAETRRGILGVDWARNPHLHAVDCDFIPGQIIEHTISGATAEIWGGFALAYLDPAPRSGRPEIRQSARTSIRSLQHCVRNLAILD